jgi:hypothetical protein
MTVSGDPARARTILLGISAAAWIALLADPGGVLRHCPALTSTAMPFAAAFRMQLAMNPPV